MAIVRTTKSLAKRIDLSYFKKSHPLRRARWAASAVLTILAMTWLGYMSLNSGEIYMNGEVSTPHKLFGVNCKRCHTDWGALEAAVQGKPSVPDAVCEECHHGPAHHWKIAPTADKAGVKLNEPHCVECHHEHHGKRSLAQLHDNACLSCHKDLRTQQKEGYQFTNIQTGGISINAFAKRGGHPEFAVVQGVDKTPLHFNHKKHLAMDDIKSCEHCHTPNDARNYMKPITYEIHCASCHPVRISGLYESIDAEMQPKEFPLEIALPHGLQPSEMNRLIYASMASVLTKEPGINPDVYTKEESGRGRRKKISIEWKEMPLKDYFVKQSDYLQGQVQEQLKKVVDDASNGCKLCHEVVDDDEDILKWKIRETGIPQDGSSRRWLVHSRFTHKPHRMLKCTECHFAIREGNQLHVADSTQTEDVLIAGVDTCRSCHNAERNSARADCVECHHFHQKADDKSLYGKNTIHEIFDDYLEAVTEDVKSPAPGTPAAE